MQNNIYTTKLIDMLYVDDSGKASLFIVMDHMQADLKSMMN